MMNHSSASSFSPSTSCTFSTFGSSILGTFFKTRSPTFLKDANCSSEVNFLFFIQSYHPLSQLYINYFHYSMLSANFFMAASKEEPRSIYTSCKILVATLSTIFFFGYSITFFDFTRVLLADFFSWLLGGLSMRSSSSSSFKNYQLR